MSFTLASRETAPACLWGLCFQWPFLFQSLFQDILVPLSFPLGFLLMCLAGWSGNASSTEHGFAYTANPKQRNSFGSPWDGRFYPEPPRAARWEGASCWASQKRVSPDPTSSFTVPTGFPPEEGVAHLGEPWGAWPAWTQRWGAGNGWSLRVCAWATLVGSAAPVGAVGHEDGSSSGSLLLVGCSSLFLLCLFCFLFSSILMPTSQSSTGLLKFYYVIFDSVQFFLVSKTPLKQPLYYCFCYELFDSAVFPLHDFHLAVCLFGFGVFMFQAFLKSLRILVHHSQLLLRN